MKEILKEIDKIKKKTKDADVNIQLNIWSFESGNEQIRWNLWADKPSRRINKNFTSFKELKEFINRLKTDEELEEYRKLGKEERIEK